MSYKNIILSSLKESFVSIWKNKSLFSLLFILQIVFFSVFSAISIHYLPKIADPANSIFEYFSKQRLDETSVSQNILQQKNVLGDDPLSISRNLKELIKNFRLYMIYTFVFLIFFASVGWTITHNMLHKNDFRQSIRNFCHIFIVLFFYIGLIFYFFLSLVNISFTEISAVASNLLTKYIPFLFFSLILAYFMFVSISLLNSTKLKNIVQKTLIIGIKKAHYIISAYVIVILLLIFSITLLADFVERNLLILLVSIILVVFSFVFGRIFLANVVEKLDKPA